MYEVIYKFRDLLDEDHIYEVGDVYPREGYKPTRARTKELSTADNKIGVPLITKIEVEAEE